MQACRGAEVPQCPGAKGLDAADPESGQNVESIH